MRIFKIIDRLSELFKNLDHDQQLGTSYMQISTLELILLI